MERIEPQLGGTNKRLGSETRVLIEDLLIGRIQEAEHVFQMLGFWLPHPVFFSFSIRDLIAIYRTALLSFIKGIPNICWYYSSLFRDVVCDETIVQTMFDAIFNVISAKRRYLDSFGYVAVDKVFSKHFQN